MEEIQSDTSSSSIAPVVKNIKESTISTCYIKPKPPLVPPKPSKSKETLNQTFSPIDTPTSVQNQSFGTDDEPYGDNLALGFPPIPESFHLSQVPNCNPASGDGNIIDESGNRSQVSAIEEDSNSVQVINQPDLITEDSSNPNGPMGYSNSVCPYNKLHHKSQYEFLSFPQIPDEDKTILFGIDDISSKVDQKIGFIVQNLKNNCSGVWSTMSLEKLNRIIVHADFNKLKTCLQEDNYAIIKQLIEMYSEEKRCPMVFRYWCTFYHIVSRNLAPYYILLNYGLVDQLQKDFMQASNDSCRCNISDCKDEEHKTMGPVQLQVISILMIPLFTTQARSDYFPINESRIDKAEFISSVLRAINKKFNEIYDTKDSKSSLSDKESEKDGSSFDTSKTSSVHLILAYNLQFEDKQVLNPIVEALASPDFEISFLKQKIIKIYYDEHSFFVTGNSDGLASLIECYGPFGIQIRGIFGPMKLIIDILKANRSFFDIVDLLFMLETNRLTRHMLKDNGFWDDKTEEIYINCQILQELLERHLGFLQWERREADLSNLTPRSSLLSVSSQGSVSEKIKASKKPISTMNSKTLMQTYEAVLNCFGCSKRNTSTVAPATPEDIQDELI